jgi:hypothetical protein
MADQTNNSKGNAAAGEDRSAEAGPGTPGHPHNSPPSVWGCCCFAPFTFCDQAEGDREPDDGISDY